MPAPPGSVRFEIRGTGIGSEIWMTGYWYFVNSEGFDQAALIALNEVVAPFVTTWWNAIKGNIYTSYALTELRAYYYSGGSDNAEFAAVHAFTSNPGTLATAGAPVDTACCVSTRTALVGRSHRGRMYIPCHVTTAVANGLMVGAPQATYVTATAAMLTSVNASAGYVIVASRMLGTGQAITSVSADGKPDVQRRRENRLSGGAVSSAAVT